MIAKVLKTEKRGSREVTLSQEVEKDIYNGDREIYHVVLWDTHGLEEIFAHVVRDYKSGNRKNALSAFHRYRKEL